MEISGHQSEKKKIVLITGCAKNSIGDHLAQEFFRRGFHVIATSRSLPRVQHLKDMGCTTIALDTTSSESIENLRQQIDHLDILINNAGINHVAMFADTSLSDFKKQFETNTFAPFAVTQALLPLLIESKGIIVNHTSQSAHALGVLCCAYAASKAALANLTDNLRIELAPFGIRVVQLVTGCAASNITTDWKASSVPQGSIYAPVKAEIDKAMSEETVKGRIMAGDVYARKVVGDILKPSGPPVWIWRGWGASIMYTFWYLGCLWKGSMDGLFSKVAGLSPLAARLKEQSQKKDQ